MPTEIGDSPHDKSPKHLARKANRSLLRLGIERVQYIGRAIGLLRSFELDVRRDWARAGELDVLECVQARASLWKIMDGILDRRRILCGDPLPRGGGQKQVARTLDLEPMGLAAEEPPMTEPPTGVD
jgi:hypothetical protein